MLKLTVEQGFLARQNCVKIDVKTTFNQTYTVFDESSGAATDEQVVKVAAVVSQSGVVQRRSTDVVANVENLSEVFRQETCIGKINNKLFLRRVAVV